MQRTFIDDKKLEDCFKISHNDLLLSCEKAGLTGKIRYVITVSPLAPIISHREFNQGEIV
jgi:hypothetical protein